MPTVVDYSWAKPDPACLRSSGYVGVMRYLSWDRSGKNLTRDEVVRLHAHGLWVGLNWEGQGNWSEFSTGPAGGSRAGAEAARQCAALDAPASVPIFVSADYGAPATHWPAIETWLRSFAAACGREIGFYGQGNLADWLLDRGTVRWVWQTNATGWGGVSQRAVLRQHLWTDVCGASCDPNTLVGDPRLWAWMPHDTIEEDDMTPDQAKQLTAAVASSQRAADQASVAAMQSAGAMRLAQVALSWAAVGGIPVGIESIYQTCLGRPVDDAGRKAWAKVATEHTYDEVLLRVAASDEAKARTVA